MNKIILQSGYPFVELVPLNDLHFGSEECNESLIDESIDYIKRHNQCFTFLNGDIIECATYGKMGGVHKQKHQLDEQVEYMIEKLKPIRKKILFSVCGNHEYRIEKATGLNLAKVMSDTLEIPFAGWECNFMIKMKNKVCRLYAHHGAGGSVTSGAKVNSVERLHFRSPFANILICGHLHFPVNTEKEICYLDNAGNLRSFTQHFVACGSAHKSGGYASMKGYGPVPCSISKIKIIPRMDDFDIIVDKMKG